MIEDMTEEFFAKIFVGKCLENPDFDAAGYIHDWRNYVGERVQSIWHLLDYETRAAIALDADERATNEEWE